MAELVQQHDSEQMNSAAAVPSQAEPALIRSTATSAMNSQCRRTVMPKALPMRMEPNTMGAGKARNLRPGRARGQGTRSGPTQRSAIPWRAKS
jgi:hypothetical protein